MVRLPQLEVLDPRSVEVAHVYNRCIRRCFLMGDDAVSGKNYDHRKVWIEQYLQQFAAAFGIDLLGFSILSNHFHLILRTRPDVVETWDDEEVARRWLMLCPFRRNADGTVTEPSTPEINSIAGCPIKRAEICNRLSDISWWMRLLCQRVAMRANREDKNDKNELRDIALFRAGSYGLIRGPQFVTFGFLVLRSRLNGWCYGSVASGGSLGPSQR